MAYKPLDKAAAETAADQLRVAAHPVRLRMLHLLRANPAGLSVTQIYRGLDIAQAIASQHLITMKDRGLLTSMKAGTSVTYELATAAKPLADSLLGYLATK